MSLRLSSQEIREALAICVKQGQVLKLEVEGEELYLPLPDQVDFQNFSLRLGQEWKVILNH